MRLMLASVLIAAPASAGEGFAGVSAHGVDLGLVTRSYERGVDLTGGFRSAPVARLGSSEVRLHALASLNLAGGVSFIAAGASLRVPIGRIFYLQPGLGLAIHDGPGDDFQRTPDRLYLGSRVLLEPELTIGARLSRRWAAEIAYVHLSHAQIAGPQNPGLDTIGARLVYRFGN